MQGKSEYLDLVTTEVDDLTSRIAVLRGRFAKQKVSVKLDHYWELECVRTRFAEFKKRVEELEDADDFQLAHVQEHVEIAWNDLTQAVDTLLAALP
jgi:hypothetical protein